MTDNAHTKRDLHSDWNERLGLAQEMLPLISRLHRDKNVVTSIFGRLLVNVTDIEIIKSHRYARRVVEKELPLEQTLPVLRELVEMNLGTASIDIGSLASRYSKDSEGLTLREYLERELADVIGGTEQVEPRDIVLYGFGRIGRLLARILVAREATYGGARLRAVVVRSKG